MGPFSSGSQYKNAAIEALESARAIESQQKDIDFQRGLLSNIRQQRMAQAQLSVMNYSDAYTSSSIEGASANINSALASEMKYSYESSNRAEEIQHYQEEYQRNMDKYAKQQKRKSAGFAVVGAVIGAVTGGLGYGLTGAVAGATIGQGVGQMASNTGQFETGLNNVIAGGAQAYQMSKTAETAEKYETLLDRFSPKKYETTSIDPRTGQPIAGSTVTTTYVPGSLNYLSNFYKP